MEDGSLGHLRISSYGLDGFNVIFLSKIFKVNLNRLGNFVLIVLYVNGSKSIKVSFYDGLFRIMKR